MLRHLLIRCLQAIALGETGSGLPTEGHQRAVKAFQREIAHMEEGNKDETIADLTQAIRVNAAYKEAHFYRELADIQESAPSRAIDQLYPRDRDQKERRHGNCAAAVG